MSDEINKDQALSDVVRALRLNHCPISEIAGAVNAMREHCDRLMQQYHYLERKYLALRELAPKEMREKAVLRMGFTEPSRSRDQEEPMEHGAPQPDGLANFGGRGGR